MKEEKTAYERPESVELDTPCTLVGKSGCPNGTTEDIPAGGCPEEADDV